MHRFFVSLVLTVLAACDAPAEAPECAGSTAAVSQGLNLTAYLQDAARSAAGGLETHWEAVECASYTVTQPGSAWQVDGTTPAGVALAPGEYVVELGWVDSGQRFISEPTPVTVGHGSTSVALDLCADLSGEWMCSDGQDTWAASAEMGRDCSVALSGTEAALQVSGQVIYSGFGDGLISAQGTAFVFPDEGCSISCWRAE